LAQSPMYFLIEPNGALGAALQIPFESCVILSGGFVMNPQLFNAHCATWLNSDPVSLPRASS